MECAMWQNAVFNANLNDDREKAAQLSAFNAHILLGVALRTGQAFSLSVAFRRARNISRAGRLTQ
jgi:hypothetical protein